MIDYAFKNITRRWVRSLLTIIGVAMMMTLVIAITRIVNYQKQTMNAHAAASTGKIHVQTQFSGMSYPAAVIDLPAETADAILQVDDIQPTLSGKVIYFSLLPPPYPNEPPQLLLTGIDRGKEEAFTGQIAHNVNPVQGVEFFAQANAVYPLILGLNAHAHYVEETGRPLSPGDTLTLLDQDFTIIGILDSSADKVVNNSLIIPLEIVQELLSKQGFVSSVLLVPASVQTKSELVAGIEQCYPKLNIITDDHIQRNAEAGIKVFEQLINTISIVVTAGAAILLMTVTIITVKERTKEIGVLRAIGGSHRVIISSVLWEIFLLSLTGSVLGGVIAGLVLRFSLTNNLFDLWYTLKFLPLSIVLTLIAGIVPVINITRIMPVDSLRYE
jgi:putative ABC transport system permease protein